MSSAVEPEYFWLCGSCQAAMTLALREDGVVVLAPGPPQRAHGIRRAMPLAVNRSRGLLLRSVSFWPRPSQSANDRY